MSDRREFLKLLGLGALLPLVPPTDVEVEEVDASSMYDVPIKETPFYGHYVSMEFVENVGLDEVGQSIKFSVPLKEETKELIDGWRDHMDAQSTFSLEYGDRVYTNMLVKRMEFYF